MIELIIIGYDFLKETFYYLVLQNMSQCLMFTKDLLWDLYSKVQIKTECKFQSWSVGLRILTQKNTGHVFWCLVLLFLFSVGSPVDWTQGCVCAGYPVATFPAMQWMLGESFPLRVCPLILSSLNKGNFSCKSR